MAQSIAPSQLEKVQKFHLRKRKKMKRSLTLLPSPFLSPQRIVGLEFQCVLRCSATGIKKKILKPPSTRRATRLNKLCSRDLIKLSCSML
jgi:hypothetical protein